ncbi:hypothetical protein [Clostridium saccharoperbutylacetonicum]|uniref:hypothetical protein n=1 Tax=Clostridium saccharoperbutylacetonicum TaxID=36745 RepID=UPI000983F460|nr:hypothetical protein [Clostridium saccharoperbutylacetonicum]AQR96977.1 hypothetical protein CLSAP_43010 [Clostridium saccharoperbutylacetonicum]NSB32856.1 hypothetical protein [Clostridium saccharoperbutylacetonicum]
MKNILIIRSVSFQQLDLNLPAIKEKYSPCKLSLLTHEHGVKLAEKYSDIENIFIYPYKDGFNLADKVKELSDINFDVVVVPVTNINGGGFFNVLKFSKSINSKERVMCNVISEIKSFTIGKIYCMEVKTAIMQIISLLGTLIISPLVLIILLLKLKGIEKK